MTKQLKDYVLDSRVTYWMSKAEAYRVRLIANRAQRRHHEVCGIVVLGLRRRLRIVLVANRSDDECTWKLSQSSIRKVREQELKEGEEVFATFHSHPISEAIPGTMDIRTGFYHRRAMIFDCIGSEYRLWHKSKINGKIHLKELALKIR